MRFELVHRLPGLRSDVPVTMHVSCPRWPFSFALLSAIFVAHFADAADAPAPPPREFGACKTTPTQTELDAARGAFLLGRSAYQDARYDAAIRYLTDAYLRTCTKHELLVYLAKAYESWNRPSEAIDALTLYLERAPKAPDRVAVEENLRKLRTQAATDRKPPMDVQRPPGPSAPAATATPPSEPSPKPARVGPYVLASVGVVEIGAGIALALVGSNSVASGRRDCVQDADGFLRCTGGASDDERARAVDTGRTMEIGGVALVATGAVTLGAGVLWLILSPKKSSGEESRAARLMPSLGRGPGGAMSGDLAWRF